MNQTLSGAINLPINSQLSARIAGEGEQRDGTVDSVTGGFKYNNRNHGSVRAELLYRPNENYQNYLEATYYQVREIGNLPILIGVANPALDPLLAYQQSLGKDKTVNNFPAPFDVDYSAVTDIATAHIGGLTFKNIAHMDYAHYHVAFDLTGTGQGILDQDDFQSNHNYSDELQVLGKAFDNRLNWLLGAYYNKFIQDEYEVFDLESQPGNPFSPQTINLNAPQTSTAVFGQATYDFSKWIDGLSLTAGYRYTWDDKTFTQQRLQTGGFIAVPFPPGFMAVPTCAILAFPGTDPTTCTEHLSAHYSSDNYNVSLNWQANAHTLVYLAARKGYKAGGFNFAATDPAFIEYKPETVADVELGLKADFKLGEIPVRTNLAVYQSKYENIQAQFISTSPSGLPEALIVNQDPVTGENNKATLTGGELEITAIPVRGLEASAFYGYTEGKYDQFIDRSTGSPISLAGQQIDGIAKTTAGFTVNYSPELPDALGRPTATAVLYYRSKLSSNELNPAMLGDFTTLDLRLDWRKIGGGPVDVAIYGKNVTDKRYPTISEAALLNVVGVNSQQLNEPATYGIELRYRFGAGR